MFGFRKRREKKSLERIVENREGWFLDKDFFKLMKIEQNRYSRSGAPLYYALFDISNSVNKPTKISENDYLEFLKQLIELISDNTRDCDIKHLINRYRLGILLIDPSVENTKHFVERISLTLHQYFGSPSNKIFNNIIRYVNISVFPVSQGAYQDVIEEIPMMQKSLRFDPPVEAIAESPAAKYVEPHAKNPVSLKLYSERSGFFVNWKFSTAPFGSAALSVPNFWDMIQGKPFRLDFHFWKRAVDIFGSLVGIILTLPVMAVVALAIKATSKGPVLFKQTRVGYLGRTFTVLKFRTMKTDGAVDIHKAHQSKFINGEIGKGNGKGNGNGNGNGSLNGKPLFKVTDDPRITSIGHFLRETSLDELPQFFNVLRGDMSLVGPRPPIPYEVEMYQAWHRRRIFDAKPGLTGLWQVYRTHDTTFNEMVRYDLRYVKERCIWMDIKIMLQTIYVIFNKRFSG